MDQEIFTTIEQIFNRLVENIGSWVSDHGFAILLIILSAWAIRHFSTKVILQLLQKTVRRDLYPTKSDRTKRLKTLESLISAILHITVFILALVMIFSELGLNTTPVIASAGIIGIALGFGAQSLIKDIASG